MGGVGGGSSNRRKKVRDFIGFMLFFYSCSSFIYLSIQFFFFLQSVDYCLRECECMLWLASLVDDVKNDELIYSPLAYNNIFNS